jgi:hypothetical protein
MARSQKQVTVCPELGTTPKGEGGFRRDVDQRDEEKVVRLYAQGAFDGARPEQTSAVGMVAVPRIWLFFAAVKLAVRRLIN